MSKLRRWVELHPKSHFFFLAGVLFLIVFVVYWYTLQPSVSHFGDSAKFQFVAHLLGVPHTTGYPLYVTLAKVFTWFPVGDGAFRVTFLSAVAASTAVTALGVTLWMSTQDLIAAAGAALLFGWSSTLWSQATIAEVYTLNAAFVILVILLLVIWWQRRNIGWYIAALIVYGLSLGNHATMVLLAPGIALFVLISNIDMVRRPRHLVLLAIPVVLVLAQYLGLYVRARQHPAFCEYCPDTWSRLLWYLTGAQFRNRFLAFPFETWVERVIACASLFVQEYGVAVLLLGFFGALVMYLRPRWRPLLILVSSLLIVNLLFTASYDIPDFANYLIPSYLVIALFVGHFWAYALRRVRYRWQKGLRRRVGVGGLTSLALLLPAFFLVINFPLLDRSTEVAARQDLSTLLSTLPSEAILVSPPCCEFYDPSMGVLYLQYVEGLGKGVEHYRFLPDGRGGKLLPYYIISEPVTPTLLSPSVGKGRSAYAPQLSRNSKAFFEEHFILRPIDTSQIQLVDYLNVLPQETIVLFLASKPVVLPRNEEAEREHMIALEDFGFEALYWPEWGRRALIGVKGAEGGTAIEMWDPEVIDLQVAKGELIGSTGIRAPVHIRLRSSGSETDIVVGMSNLSSARRDYQVVALDSKTGQVISTAVFDTETFLTNNVRIYCLAGLREEGAPRLDPYCWSLPESRLDFSDPISAWLLVEGWSKTEHWGTWGVGSSSSLRVSVPEVDYSVEVVAQPYCGMEEKGQSLKISWNGVLLSEHIFSSCDVESFDFSLPASLVTKGVDTLRFDYAYSLSPYEVSGGVEKDRRPLAVAFTELVFVPMGD